MASIADPIVGITVIATIHATATVIAAPIMRHSVTRRVMHITPFRVIVRTRASRS